MTLDFFTSSSAPSIVRIINEETGDILVDLNDPAGTYNARLGSLRTRFGVGTAFNLGSTEDDISEFSPDSAPGGFVTKITPKLTTSSWRQCLIGPDYATMLQGANELQKLLRLGGVIALQMDSTDEPKFIDFEPWKVPALFRGEQFESFFRSKLFRDDGFPIEIRRQPYLRGFELDSDLNLLDNASLLRSTTVPGRPDRWGFDVGFGSTGISGEVIDSGLEAYKYTVSVAGQRYLNQVQPSSPGDHHTLSIYGAATVLGGGLRCILRIQYFASTDGTGVALSTVTSAVFVPSLVPARFSLSTIAGLPTGAPLTTQSVVFSFGTFNSDANPYTVYFSRAQAELSDSMTSYREGTEVVANNPFTAGGRVYPIHILGAQSTPVDLRVKGESGAKLKGVIVGSRSNEGIEGRNKLVDLINSTRFKKCTDGTLGTDASSVSGGSLPAGAMATSVVKVSNTDTQLVRRLVLPITTLLDSLRGNFEPYIRFMADNADTNYVVQAYWGFSQANPAPYPNLRVPINLKGSAGAGVWFDLPLGEINIPDNILTDLSGITLDIYTAASNATKPHYLDVVTYEPSDRLGQMFIASVAKQTWLGSELLDGAAITSSGTGGALISGTVIGNEYQINAAGEACALAPAAGLLWPAGHHILTVRGHGPTGKKVSPSRRILVRNITDSTNKPDTVNIIDFDFASGVTGSAFESVIEFDSVAGKALQPQIIFDTGQPATYISAVDHEVVVSVGQDETIKSDFDSYEIHRLNSDGTLSHYALNKGRWPVWCDPGLNVLIPIFNDPGRTGTPDSSLATRAPIVGFSYKPRWYQ